MLAFGKPESLQPMTYSALNFLVFGGCFLVPILMVVGLKTKNGLAEGLMLCILQWFGILIIYENLTSMTSYLTTSLCDSPLRYLDSVLFGETPAIIMDKIGFVDPGLTVFFSFIYVFVYIVFPPTFALYLLMKGEREELSKYLCVVSVVAMSGFLLYLLVPAIGPSAYYSADFKNALGDSSKVVVDLQHYAKNAFPSMHTALVAIFAIFAYRNSKKIFWISLPFILALLFSTIYLRQHYFVDLVAGLALAFFAYSILMLPRVSAFLSKDFNSVVAKSVP